MKDERRNSGIDVIGDVPWGTHFCQFYKTKQDLIDILVPYFKAGLENNEFCMWITSEPLMAAEAEDTMRQVVKNFDKYRSKGQIEVIPYNEWYLLEDTFNDDRVLTGWVSKLEHALARGYDGLRLTGNTFWLERNHWRAFTECEAKVNNVIGRYPMLAVCTYSLDKCDGAAVIDVVRNHQFALIKQDGIWDIIESSIYKQAKEALQQSEERYRSLFSNMTEGFALHEIILDDQEKPCDYRFIEVNEAFGRQTGLLPEKIIGKTVREVLPGVEDYWIETYGKVALTGEAVSSESFSAPLAKWYEVYAYSPKRGVCATLLKDITERKQREQEWEQLLKEVADLNEYLNIETDILETIMENTWAQLAYFDADLNFVEVNSTYARGCGHTKEELIGKNHFALFPNPENQTIFEQVRDTGKPVEFHDKPFEFTDQPERGVTYWDWTLTPIKDFSGKVRGLVLSLIETTTRKKMEDLKDEFIGLVSHELRTPLTVISGCVSTILTERERLSPDEIQQLLQDAEMESDSMAQLIENLLELSRFQAQRFTLYAEPSDIKTLIVDTLTKIKRRALSHQFSTRFPDKLPLMNIDPLRIGRVLYNLLDNAAKYSPSGSHIEVSAKREPKRLVLAVSDQGRGLSTREKTKLFSPFQRLENERPDRARGTGVGLVVCRRLVEAHGGEIWVESEKGKGSTFFFSLPCEKSTNAGKTGHKITK